MTAADVLKQLAGIPAPPVPPQPSMSAQDPVLVVVRKELQS